MAAGRCDFESALRPFLADDLRKIHNILPTRGGVPPVVPGQFPVQPGVPYKQRTAILLFFQDPDHILKGLDPENGELAALSGFERGPERQNAAGKSVLPGQFREGQGAGHFPDRSVQAQFPHNQVPVEPRQIPLSGGRDDPQRDREVIAAAILVHIRRRQIDDDLLAGNMEPQRLERGDCAQKAFFDGDICQADQMNPDPRGDVHLDRHRDRFDADALRPMNVDKHVLEVFDVPFRFSFLNLPTKVPQGNGNSYTKTEIPERIRKICRMAEKDHPLAMIIYFTKYLWVLKPGRLPYH